VLSNLCYQAGPVVVNDCYKASPYANFFYTAESVPGGVLQPLLARLNARAEKATEIRAQSDHKRRGVQATRGWPARKLPAFVATTLTSSAPSYDIIYCDFDAAEVEAVLGSLIGRENVRTSVYAAPKNDTTVLLEYCQRISKQW
jgi:hypothetical protein